ncbi:MAG: HAMP domain-containing histidine kinase [bacterium]|nr:HAMP domain-containing histidine kinase [bacterium]
MNRGLVSGGELAAAMRVACEQGRAVALLAVRLPEFAQLAWRDGRRAALRLERMTARAVALAAARVMREGDLAAHDAGSDWFALAMLAPARDGAFAQALDARSALERIAAAVSLATGQRMETGWYALDRAADLDDLGAAVARALERGARERERYEFLAAVGHELRTPLTSIRGYLETLLDDEIDASTARRFLGVARAEAVRLARLVDGMLDFSLLDLEAPVLAARRADVRGVALAAADALAPIAREAGIALEVAPGDAVLARIDADACAHALLNLIENALKHGRRGGRVCVSVERQDPYVELAVDDDGPGVPLGERERIFAHRTRGSGACDARGRGIGLAIVRAIVERVAGSVSVTNSPLGGARFAVRLPSARAESAARSS